MNKMRKDLSFIYKIALHSNSCNKLNDSFFVGFNIAKPRFSQNNISERIVWKREKRVSIHNIYVYPWLMFSSYKAGNYRVPTDYEDFDM